MRYQFQNVNIRFYSFDCELINLVNFMHGRDMNMS